MSTVTSCFEKNCYLKFSDLLRDDGDEAAALRSPSVSHFAIVVCLRVGVWG